MEIKYIDIYQKTPRREAAYFAEFLSQKYLQKPVVADLMKKKSIVESSFRGIWKDRKDMKDSTKWVRQVQGTGLSKIRPRPESIIL